MDMARYLRLMEFHPKWQEYDLLPSELIDQLIASYEPGMENASEHERNSFFHWWLKRNPSRELLGQLWELSELDPDQLMAGDVRRPISMQLDAYGSHG